MEWREMTNARIHARNVYRIKRLNDIINKKQQQQKWIKGVSFLIGLLIGVLMQFYLFVNG
jgi:hypothetical protein